MTKEEYTELVRKLPKDAQEELAVIGLMLTASFFAKGITAIRKVAEEKKEKQ